MSAYKENINGDMLINMISYVLDDLMIMIKGESCE